MEETDDPIQLQPLPTWIHPQNIMLKSGASIVGFHVYEILQKTKLNWQKVAE